MITRHVYRVCATAVITVLVWSSCDTSQSPMAIQLPACDPVAPRPPCDPRPPDPTLLRAIHVVDGDTQAANVGLPLPKPLTVRVTNGNNVPVANVRVRWLPTPGVSVSDTSALTDANGLARVQLTVGASVGAYITGSMVAGSASASVQFTSFAQMNGAYRLKVNPRDSGLEQSDTVFTQLAKPYKITVVNYQDVPLAGVTVNWTLYGGGKLSSTVTTTDENGVAQVSHTLGSRSTFEEAQASVQGLLNSPFSFVAYVQPGRTVLLKHQSGGGTLGVVNTSAPDYVVRSTDAYGNATNAANVDWTVTSGGGSIQLRNPVTAVHTLGPDAGQQTVTATLRGTNESVTFATNAVSGIIAVGWDYYSCGGAVFSPSEIAIPVGGVIAWIWYASYYCSATHNVVFDDDPDQSGLSARFTTFARQFTAPGTFRYRCTLHSTSFTEGEVGVVRVQ